ncbi:MAG: hypothetical protein CYPHOPRED_001323 [Cyphobasidiales sp. Tagirdzhanova-0007]|nr:MAG: hypothetical protein CYPHOPRED_001323 [Cyphobasidiales sp. Tagirdzhanova-0007]
MEELITKEELVPLTQQRLKIPSSPQVIRHVMSDHEEAEDLEALNQVEATFYKSGYEAGFQHGQAHGVFDGRALGQEKGFEIWEEIGYYLGQAKFCEAVARTDPAKQRGLHHVEQLVALIDRFPSFNDSSKRQDDQDMELMLQNIRSKYRILCSSFGRVPSSAEAVRLPTTPYAGVYVCLVGLIWLMIDKEDENCERASNGPMRSTHTQIMPPRERPVGVSG